MGSTDFTLVGRPIIDKSLVKITATVIEKTLSHTKTHFKKKRRKQYKRINCTYLLMFINKSNFQQFNTYLVYRLQQTMLRINSIEVTGEVNNPKEVTGLDTAVF